MQTATLPQSYTANAKNLTPTKELTQAWSVIGSTPDADLRELIVVRWYMARSGDGASPVYCSLWVCHSHGYSGHGRATGYGYHKASAAFSAACDSAGIKLSERVDGCGESAVREALEAIARTLGFENVLITEHA